MEDTFHSRIVKLIQKSRKALRLYTSVGRLSQGKNTEYQELQTSEWRQVNAELIEHLTIIVNKPNQSQASADIFALRDRYYSEWRMNESEMHKFSKRFNIFCRKW